VSLTGIEVPAGLLAGGEGREGGAARFPVIDPAAENVLTEVADATGEDALEAAGAGSSCRRRRSSAASAAAVYAAVHHRGPSARGRDHRREGPEFDFRILRNSSESSVLARATNDLMLRTMPGVPEGAALAIRSAIRL